MSIQDSSFEQQQFAEGLALGRYDKMRTSKNPMRPMGQKTERRIPNRGRREVVPSSRPRDAGATLQYRFTKDLQNCTASFRAGYLQGMSESLEQETKPILNRDQKIAVRNQKEGIKNTLRALK